MQILEITDKAVLCLNLMDEAKRLEIEIDERTLAKDLGIPVVPTSARFKEGIPELIKTVQQVASGEIECNPHRIKSVPKKVSVYGFREQECTIKKILSDILLLYVYRQFIFYKHNFQPLEIGLQ